MRPFCLFLLLLCLGALYLYIAAVPTFKRDTPAALWVFAICNAYSGVVGLLAYGAFGGFSS